MDLLDKLAVIILMLMASSFATITINIPPSPANNSVVVGTSATFNWTASGIGCVASQVWIFKENNSGLFVQFGVIPVAACSGQVSLTNLSDGTYGWVVGITAVPLENSSFYNFTVNPSINLTILYPPNNSAYGPAQCSLLTTIQINDTGGPSASRLITVWLYENNGTTWLLNKTKTCSNNCTVNWTGLIDSAPYAVNASATVDGASANSLTTNFNLVGNSFCSGQPNDTEPDWAFNSLAILGTGLLLAGVWWSK